MSDHTCVDVSGRREKKKNMRAQRKRALKRGKEKIKTAKQKALAAETKKTEDTSWRRRPTK